MFIVLQGMLSTLVRWTGEFTGRSPRLMLFQPMRSRLGREKYRRRINDLKEKLVQPKKKLPYQEDVTPLRPPKDLWKALGFSAGVCLIFIYWNFFLLYFR